MKYFEDDGNPVKCHNCESENIKRITKDITAGTVCEVEYRCGDCDTYLGYWAYGSFEPNI